MFAGKVSTSRNNISKMFLKCYMETSLQFYTLVLRDNTVRTLTLLRC